MFFMGQLRCVLRQSLGRALLAASVLTTSIAVSPAYGTDIITAPIADGNFAVLPTGPENGGIWTLGTNAAFGSWKVTQGNVRFYRQGGTFKDTAHMGNAVEVIPGQWNTRGTITQTFPTTKGTEYTVLFSYGGQFSNNNYGKRVNLKVRRGADNIEFGSMVWTYDIKPADWTFSKIGWRQAEYRFVAQSDSTKLEFFTDQLTTQKEGMLITSVQTFSAPPAKLWRHEAPLPKDLNQFVKDRNRAIMLGKALFWDMQVGSDGRTACATCHQVSGIDQRFVNTLHPGAPGSTFGPQLPGQSALAAEALAGFRGANATLKGTDFPFHRVEKPLGDHDSNKVLFDTEEVVGSQGVIKRKFEQIVPGSPVDNGQLVADPVFKISGANARQVTGRNSPTNINAVFLDRLFWDGRANHFFNGVNPFGNLDPNAKVLKRVPKTVNTGKWVWKSFGWWGMWQWVGSTTYIADALEPTSILLNNAALASQAVGPPLNEVEMSWHGRDFKALGRKLLSLRPLALQQVSPQDSVLGWAADPTRKGLRSEWDYARLIRESFHDDWWNSTQKTPEGHTMMEANFSLYWGLALMMYQSTLISDETPYDAFALGDRTRLSPSAKRGLATFMSSGKCINCHTGPEFAGATIRKLRGSTPELVEFMVMGDGTNAWYDSGFYNIGVRKTLEDIAVGASHPDFGPLSYTKQRQNGRDIGQSATINKGDRVAVNGAFKAPSLRNIELTGPYFHNGGARTLEEVVQFYVRGADFFHENIADLDPDVDGISELRNNPQGVADLVAFMKSLTDERVRLQKAPFDHPELVIPNGHSGVVNGLAQDQLITLPAVGMNGGPVVVPFDQIVR